MTDEKINSDTLARIESANRVKKHESMEEYAGRSLSPKEVDEMWEKIQANKKKDAAIMKKETQSRSRAKNKAKPMGKKKGGYVKSSAQTSVIPGARATGSAQGSTIPGPKAKGSAEGSVIPMKMRSGGLAKRGYGKARR